MFKIKKERLGVLLQTVFFLIFSVSFAFIGAGVLFNQSWYNYTSLLLLLLGTFFIALVCVFYRFVSKYEQKLSGKYPVILAVFCVFMLSVQLVFGSMLRFAPIYDMEAIYKGAIEWVNTGTFVNYHSDTCYADYFYIFKNNLGAMAFLAVIFKLCNVLGIGDYFFAATVVNSVLSICTMCLISLVCKRLWGTAKALFALFLCMIFPPFYFCAAVFYTDFLTIIFPVLAFYLYLEATRAENTKIKVALHCAGAFVAALGILIKFTVIIVVIAIALAMLLKKQWKNLMIYAVCSAVIIGGVQLGFNAIIYSNHLDRSVAAEKNTPYSHWIMMGLNKDGDYESDDFWNTRSYDTQAERKAAISAEIKARLKGLGPMGLASLMTEKAVRCFGDGTCNLSDFLDDNPKEQTFLHNLLIAGGSKHYFYRHICAGIYFVPFVLMLFAAVGALFGGKKERRALVPMLCIFGIMLFLLMWEVNSRYIVNFLPMMFICAVGGIDFFINTVKKTVSKIGDLHQ